MEFEDVKLGMWAIMTRSYGKFGQDDLIQLTAPFGGPTLGETSLWHYAKRFEDDQLESPRLDFVRPATLADIEPHLVKGDFYEVSIGTNRYIIEYDGLDTSKTSLHSKRFVTATNLDSVSHAGGAFNTFIGKVKEIPTAFLKDVKRVGVFPGIYVGDIVVSLANMGKGVRNIDDLFEVQPESRLGSLYYKMSSGALNNSTNPKGWRKATELEVDAYRHGVANINNIQTLPIEGSLYSATPYSTNTVIQSKSPDSIGYVRCIKHHVNFTIGKVYNWPNPVDDTGKVRRGVDHWYLESGYFEPVGWYAVHTQAQQLKKEEKQQLYGAGLYQQIGPFEHGSRPYFDQKMIEARLIQMYPRTLEESIAPIILQFAVISNHKKGKRPRPTVLLPKLIS